MWRSPRRSPVSPFGPCLTPFRVWFTDLDPLLHMNNGIYLCIMDLGRLDLMIRSGLWRVVNAQRWYTVVVAETIQFRRSLNLFQRFTISTRVLRKSGGNVAPRELALAAGMDTESPPLESYAARWNADQATWQGASIQAKAGGDSTCRAPAHESAPDARNQSGAASSRPTTAMWLP